MEVRSAAEAFLRVGFRELTRIRVLPVPMFGRFIKLGTHYAGSVMYEPEFVALEKALRQAFPEHFNIAPLEPGERLPASHWIFGLLEAAVAASAAYDEDPDPNWSFVAELIDDLLEQLQAGARGLVHCRVISHLTTSTMEPVEFEDVTIIPVPDPAFAPELMRMVMREIPMARQAFLDAPPIAFDHPRAIVVARSNSSMGRDPFAALEALSRRVDRFLLLSRLVTGTSGRAVWSISGSTGRVSEFHPLGKAIASANSGPQMIKRVGVLSDSLVPGFSALAKAIDDAEVTREKRMFASFDFALARFTRSYASDDLADSLVDLATSMEGILLGGDAGTEDVGLRLRSRAAALLATKSDPAPTIYRDVSDLYSIRSKLVHGSTLEIKELMRLLRRVVPDHDDKFGAESFAFAVDRLRDLVRRAILARLALAADQKTHWTFQGTTSVDAQLSDDSTRQVWRSVWRATMNSHGLDAACEPAPKAEGLYF
ncbi:hypothetical protein ASF88_19935 [Leifsonia sp. Leaf336]|nr:hypothetical protein ASF88_19935 [Leifsonia sp. Leaf336]